MEPGDQGDSNSIREPLGTMIIPFQNARIGVDSGAQYYSVAVIDGRGLPLLG